MMADQAEAVGLKTLPTFLKYLVKHFAVLYHQTGHAAMRDIVMEILASNDGISNDKSLKRIRGVDEEIERQFNGYNDFMDCGGHAEFLRYLVLQHKIHEDSMEIEDLRKIVHDYVVG